MAMPDAALVVLDLAVTKFNPKAPDTFGKVKWDVNVVCAAFKVLVSEYSATASERTSLASVEVGRSWIS